MELAFSKANYPIYLYKRKIFLTQPSNDVGGSKLKERNALSLATLGGNPFDSEDGQQFCSFVLFRVFDGGQYQIVPQVFITLSEVCPFFVRNEMMPSNKTGSDLEEPLCHQDFAISK